ncbi:DUF3265 domain-containing protein [Vibrio furnissii]|nr:DUF3265 domain-containing protein [Vibrio furnissii]
MCLRVIRNAWHFRFAHTLMGHYAANCNSRKIIVLFKEK